MNEKHLDIIGPSLHDWTRDLTIALGALKLNVIYHAAPATASRIGSLHVSQLGQLYKIDFHPKIKRDKFGNSTRAVELFCYNPDKGSNVKISVYSAANVEKVANYAFKTIGLHQEKERTRTECERRSIEAAKILTDRLRDTGLPSWARIRALIDSDEEVGLFALYIDNHHAECPLKKLTPDQISAILGFISVTISSKNIKVS